eukprot:CAMPEP_0174984142 /NCGR_PEP_ID=MMETSP0004_2-20121128/17555_1 /TAXON_ID=420556 /ORGANISM="Ochromonas sp., Strain CCMP1393" /LENGTH=225 /DNA_ID=CAMNT_0016236513 /DNA_START=108 /DNA_END=785 /DNA_ORIENTATION=-
MSSGVATGKNMVTIPKHLTTVQGAPGGHFIDEEEMLMRSTFPIRPDALVKLAQDVLRSGVGVNDPDVLADNFEFCAPVVGPLKKEEYLGALKNFQILDAFPDMENNFHFVRVDPFEPNRVWWHTRAVATHTGPLLGKEPSNKTVYLPPQANSFVFNDEGKVEQVTIGYVLDRRIGNSGGLGGFFGYLYAVGQAFPFPECQPYEKSFRYKIFGWIGSLASRFQKKE